MTKTKRSHTMTGKRWCVVPTEQLTDDEIVEVARSLEAEGKHDEAAELRHFGRARKDGTLPPKAVAHLKAKGVRFDENNVMDPATYSGREAT